MVHPCYTQDMRSSFVAVITHCGLESLMPECQEVHRLLWRGMYGHATACLWAVMERDQASAIRSLLWEGESEWALDEFIRATAFKGPLQIAREQISREAAS